PRQQTVLAAAPKAPALCHEQTCALAAKYLRWHQLPQVEIRSRQPVRPSCRFSRRARRRVSSWDTARLLPGNIVDHNPYREVANLTPKKTSALPVTKSR